MPDGDAVHNRPSYAFGGAYKELCEPDFDAQHMLKTLHSALISTLRLYGTEPCQIILEVASGLHHISGNSLSPYEAYEECLQIDQIASGYVGNKRGIAIAIDACKAIVIKIIDGDVQHVTPRAILEIYLQRILVSDLTERTSFGRQYADADIKVVNMRLAGLETEIRSQFSELATKIEIGNGIEHLRQKPIRKSGKPFDHTKALRILEFNSRDGENHD